MYRPNHKQTSQWREKTENLTINIAILIFEFWAILTTLGTANARTVVKFDEYGLHHNFSIIDIKMTLRQAFQLNFHVPSLQTHLKIEGLQTSNVWIVPYRLIFYWVAVDDPTLAEKCQNCATFRSAL
jgi:predicted branched-subunit amino acid permease